MVEKTRYTDEELEEFKQIILAKLDQARKDYEQLRAGVSNSEGNDVSDTSPTFKVLEEGAATLSKEESGRLAQRLMKFIQNLQAASSAPERNPPRASSASIAGWPASAGASPWTAATSSGRPGPPDSPAMECEHVAASKRLNLNNS